MAGEPAAEPARWVVHGERVVDDSRRARLSVARVELPDGVVLEQYVLRVPRAAVAVVLDEAGERVLMVWRHRFVIDRWVWELPGGYLDEAEDPAVCAAREAEEETGWRPRELAALAALAAFQPMAGTADAGPVGVAGEQGHPRAGDVPLLDQVGRRVVAAVAVDDRQAAGGRGVRRDLPRGRRSPLRSLTGVVACRCSAGGRARRVRG